MYFLKSGDVTNVEYQDMLSHNNPFYDELLTGIENREISYPKILMEIFEDEISSERYELIASVLTISDSVPNEYQLDQFTAMAFWFALQVNTLNKEFDSDKSIQAPYLALRAAVSWNWDYAEYLESEETVNGQLSPENVTIPISFSFILNELTLTIPVVKVKKGFLHKKEVGYMLDTNLKSCGIFKVGTNEDSYKLPKSHIMELIDKSIASQQSYIYKTPTDLTMAIDTHNTGGTVLDMLYLNGFFGIASVQKEGDIWVDAQDDLLYVQSRNAPVYVEGEENVPATWEKLREHLYRALLFKKKLYISYTTNSKVILMSS